MTFFILLALAGFLDGLSDDWRDRFNNTSRVYRMFYWLRKKTGWQKMWEWYVGTRSGQEPKRFLFFIYDYWHIVKVVKKLLTFIFIPLSLVTLAEGDLAIAALYAILGYCWEAGVFLFSYHVVLHVEQEGGNETE